MKQDSLNYSNAVWDDGEWVSWDQINLHAYDAEEVELLKRMLELAKYYHRFMDRPLPIYGEIGELFAQRRYAFELNKPGAEGSDGRFLNDLFEVKTITPFKGNDVVSVKRDDNFNILVIVRIDADHQIDSRMIERSKLPKGSGKVLRVSWDDLKPSST